MMKIELEVYEASIEGNQQTGRVRVLRQQLPGAEPPTVTFRDHDSGADLLPAPEDSILISPDGRRYRLGKRIG